MTHTSLVRAHLFSLVAKLHEYGPIEEEITETISDGDNTYRFSVEPNRQSQADAPPLTDTAAEIMLICLRHDAPLKRNKIREHVKNKEDSYFGEQLTILVEEGILVRPKTGYYELSKAGKQFAKRLAADGSLPPSNRQE